MLHSSDVLGQWLAHVLPYYSSELLWHAHSVQTALDLHRHCIADVIFLDAVSEAFEADRVCRQLLQLRSCTIVLVSNGSPWRADSVLSAMAAGAQDFLCFDHFKSTALIKENERRLKNKLALLLFVENHIDGPINKTNNGLSYLNEPIPTKLYIMGASSGGPTAISEILAKLPVSFPYPIIIIQHMENPFAAELACLLKGKCRFPVVLAGEGDVPCAGTVYLAAAGKNLILDSKLTFRYQTGGGNGFYTPSIDVFLASVAQNWSNEVVAVILSGMGNDGARGLRQIREKGGYTIVQNPDTATMSSMPQAAIDLHAACRIVDLEDVVSEFLHYRRSAMDKKVFG